MFVVVSERQIEEFTQRLVADRFYFTKIDSSGLAFQEPTVCLVIGLNQKRVDLLLGIVRETCTPFKEFIPVQPTLPAGLPPMIESRVGGAVVYSMEVEEFIQM